MQLLWPDAELAAIAVEGLSETDQRDASAKANDVADLVLYYGQASFEGSTRSTITQFKYSVADASTDFRASDAKSTIEKFARAFQDFRAKHGEAAVRERLDFELITNRPIFEPFTKAVVALANKSSQSGDVAKQCKQIESAAGLDQTALAEFAKKLRLVGGSGSLSASKSDLTGLIVDWSATSDPLAVARLGQLRQMVRDKAGSEGAGANLIRRTDILDALDISDAEELLPCKAAIPEVGKIVPREQLPDALKQVRDLTKPMLVHAAGGIGKTVFMDSLASAENAESEVVFFDCFGGGVYRSPSDARHLAQKGLIHIANTLAFRGLCDPILPGGTDSESLLRTFRRRLSQCIATIRRTVPKRGLTLFIDAIDNAEIVAHARDERAFPIQLLETLHHEPIEGVRLVVSCRTERRPTTHAQYAELQLRPFSLSETTAYLQDRLRGASQAEINVAQARSGGNPRVLQYLVDTDRRLLDASEIDKVVKLDDLIQARIAKALASAVERGFSQPDIDAFLAGLAVLPPPVPLDEYATAQGMQLSEIESFAADLRPLLERTNQGLMFRDEPTETLVRNRYASLEVAVRRVADNLLLRQDVSVYAARALPPLLHQLDDSEQLFKLAFDERVPSAITSTVGKRNVRYARIKAAVLHAAIKRDFDRIVELILELSTLAAVDERGSDYILNCPDLVVAAKDVDAERRLFEVRTGWPGTRHARLTIANVLSGESTEAYRHAVATDEWVRHYRTSKSEDSFNRPRPDRLDIAALPIFLVLQGRGARAAQFMLTWREWYSFEVALDVFGHLSLARQLARVTASAVTKYVGSLVDAGSLAAALSQYVVPNQAAKRLIAKLATACRRRKKFDIQSRHDSGGSYQLQDGLRKSAAMAMSLGLAREALAISNRAPHERPNVWTFRDAFYTGDAFPFLFGVALAAAASGKTLVERDLLPKELLPVCAGIVSEKTGKDFRDQLKSRLSKFVRNDTADVGAKKDPRKFSSDVKQEAERFVDQQLEWFVTLANTFSSFLKASRASADKSYKALLTVWEGARRRADPYRSQAFDNFFRVLGLDVALFALWTCPQLSQSSVKRFFDLAADQNASAQTLIRAIAILAQRTSFQSLAGAQALKVRDLILLEDDVTFRAKLFAQLARAMLPASIDDASTYFRNGLEQMDAIGSGDYEFTNELLIFASTLSGDELDERDFHTLSNICELNMGDEPHKFFWGAYARGMSRAAGIRGLAKLARWDDRSKIELAYTLLPYLTALVNDGKIEPATALALNRLANPVEYHENGTREFAIAIQAKNISSRSDIILELIEQFEDDNPDLPMDSTVGELASIAARVFGKSSTIANYLSKAQRQFAAARDARNEQMNYHGDETSNLAKPRDVAAEKKKLRKQLAAIVAATKPADRESFDRAMGRLDDLRSVYDLKSEFFESLRKKVAFKHRANYVRNLAASESLLVYWKLDELKEAKEKWLGSSAALTNVYKEIALRLVQIHADDLVDAGRFSGYKLKQIADLTGVSTADLSLELIKAFARPGMFVGGAVWLGFASFVSPEVRGGQGHRALKRMLESDAAELANRVTDGEWQAGLYPQANIEEVSAGLIWRVLGAPAAEDRWRAGHSIRSLARLGCWDVVDAVVKKLSSVGGGTFQARELGFYYLHARLWLLIAIARLALDFPREVVRYLDALLPIALERDEPHVLMRHFAARALVACIDAGHLPLPRATESLLRSADASTHPRLRKKIKQDGGFYQGRPKSTPKPAFEFHLDYDFHKQEVDNLSTVFGKGCWEVADMISAIVRQLDPNVKGMHEEGGRQSRWRRNSYGMSTRYHTAGQQLGWHALFYAAGKLLRDFPVTDDWWYEADPWSEWFHRNLLTREDGYWLSDGTDRTPLEVSETVLEKGKEGLVLTGDKQKLLRLIGLEGGVGNDTVVEGTWRLMDNVRVRVSSTLVSSSNARRLAKALLAEEPMIVWVPSFSENEVDDEYVRGEKKEYAPWIVCPSGENRLDEHDPFGSPAANIRPRIAREFASTTGLRVVDRFGREWKNKQGARAVSGGAWGRKERDEDGGRDSGPHPGLRLSCSKSTLKRILSRHGKDLLILLNLQRYKKSSLHDGKYTHTVAVVRLGKSLRPEYFKGCVNRLHVSRY